MSESTYCLVFEGKITPGQDLAEVKKRLQKVFNKDGRTIGKLFTGKKVKLKQGLKQEQAIQFKAKMLSIGVICEVELQAPKTIAATTSTSTSRSTFKSKPVSNAASSQPADTSSASGSSSPNLVGSPAVANVSSSSSRDSGKTLKLSDIDKAFSGTIPKVELPATYKAGVVAMGITMVLLPLIYIGLIAMLGYGVISHSIVNTTWMQTLGAKFGAIAYITPIIAGVTVILFMIKPLFAKPVVKSQTVTLDPIKEPILFHFVNKIALAVGAPRPKQINVDCEVNASASFRKGLFSFFGDDLVLTIGMPLLAGFNTRQLAGVLAHEFGHFSQGVGMRFHYLAYKINSWFFYSVYARDSWDEKLDQIASETENWVSVILNVARGGVWLTRKLLYVFMMAGHAVSSYMLRQMEFDADRYEAQLTGSQQFKNTTLQLQRLGLAYQVSHDYLAQAWEDKKLVNDFPSLVAHNASQMPEELDSALLSQMEESNAHIYDSHPSDKERIENAMQQQAKGIFSMDTHSRELFKRFDSLAKQVSQVHYAHELGLDFDPSKLVDINQVVKIAQDNEKQQEAYHAYFKDMAPVFDMPLSVNIFDTSKANWDDLLAQYKDIENQLADQISSRRMLIKKAEESSAKYQCFSAIYDLDQAGFILFPEWFDITPEVLEAHKKHMAMFEQTWKQSMAQLRPMFEINDRRMSIALTLLNHPVILEADHEHAHHLKIRNRFSLLVNNIKRNAETIIEFRLNHSRMAAFLSCAPAIGQKPTDFEAVRDQLFEDLKQSNLQLAAALGRLDYPFVAEGEHLTIAEYLDPFLPKANQFSSEQAFYIASGNVILEKLDAIYGRIISGLAKVALTVDRLIPVIEGKMPMPEPVTQQVIEQFQVAEEIEEQEEEVEYARAVGTEDFSSGKKSSFVTEQAESESANSQAVEQEVKSTEKAAQAKSSASVPVAKEIKQEEKKQKTTSSFSVEQPIASHVEAKSEQLMTDEPVAEKPKVVVREIKDAGKRSSFAIDESEPELMESRPEPVQLKPEEAKASEPATEEPEVEASKNQDSGKPSVFAIDESEPEPVETNLRLVGGKSEETNVKDKEVEKPVVALQNNDAGKPASFVIDEAEPEVAEAKPEIVKADEPVAEKPKIVVKENKDMGKPASFTIDDSEPEPVETTLKLTESKPEQTAASDAETETPVVVALQNNDAGKPASFTIDATAPEPVESKPEESSGRESGEEKPAVVALQNNDAGKSASFTIDATAPEPVESKPGADQQTELPKPIEVKSSNPFISRSAFSVKEENESSPDHSGDAVKTESIQPPPETVVPKAPNPFLANISTYKEKLAKENASGDSGNNLSQGATNTSSASNSNKSGPTISMDGLNAGSMPANMAADKAGNKEEKLSTFSTGGLSLESLTDEEAKKPDPESIVVAKTTVDNVSDEPEYGGQQEASQKFFKSPGLPNSSPTEERGLRPEPPKDLFKAFGSDDASDDELADDSVNQASSKPEGDVKSKDSDKTVDRPANH
jgi:Zn-dependent protease with chaperone function